MKGAYLLVFKADKPLRVRVGSLGLLKLPEGYYVYVGSAMGPGGIKARVSRHRRLAEEGGRRRWHVDYLLTSNQISFIEVWEIESLKPLECLLSQRLEEVADRTVLGFGSSDCRWKCRGHLHYFKAYPKLSILKVLEGLNLRWRKF